jgi:hypothetical protein
MSHSSEFSKSGEIPALRDHAKAIVLDVRAALAALLASMDVDPTLPQDMARRFGLNKMLTWKISKIIAEYDPFAAIAHFPGRSGLNIFCAAFDKSGASPKLIRSVRDAFEEYDRMVEIHAGDKATLEIMLGDLTTSQNQQRDEALRKLSFRGNSAIWGIQARVQLTTNFIAPGQESDMMDLAWLSGLVDFRRLRQDAAWSVASTRKFQDDGSPLPVGTIEPIDSDYEHSDTVPLMKRFCSEPMPEIHTSLNADGMLKFGLVNGPVGNTAATTCIIGLFGRDFVRRTRSDNETIGGHIARLGTPVELLIHDIFIHESLDFALPPKIGLYSQLPEGPTFTGTDMNSGRLPILEKVIELGTGAAAATTPEMPDYAEMVKMVYDRLEWNPSQFYGFRFKLRFPPIPSLAILYYDLPDRSS